MSKYTEEFKVAVVESYLNGRDGYRTASQRNGIKRSSLRQWVAYYRVYGAEGLKKKFSYYSGEFKLSVLKHMWDNELSCLETAAMFNIRNPPCLADWERRYRSGGIEALTPRPKGRPRSMSDPGRKPPSSADDETRTREALLAELNSLRMENAYLKKVRALVRAKRAPKKRK